MLQSIGRVGRTPFAPGTEIHWGLGGLFVLLALPALFDVVEYCRLHPVTIWEPPILLVGIVLSAVAISRTAIGQRFV